MDDVGLPGGTAAAPPPDISRLISAVSAPVAPRDPAPPKSRVMWALVGLGIGIAAAMLMAYVLRQQERAALVSETPVFERMPPGEQGCPATTNYWHGAKWPLAFPGETVTGTCAEGTRGTITRTCKAHYDWETEPEGECVPYCVAFADDNAVWPDTAVGERAAGKCMVGYTGAPMRDCLDGGTWGVIANACTKNL